MKIKKGSSNLIPLKKIKNNSLNPIINYSDYFASVNMTEQHIIISYKKNS